jgi:hypothetical protein
MSPFPGAGPLKPKIRQEGNLEEAKRRVWTKKGSPQETWYKKIGTRRGVERAVREGIVPIPRRVTGNTFGLPSTPKQAWKGRKKDPRK